MLRAQAARVLVLAPVPALRIQVLVPAQAQAQALPLQAVPDLAPAHLQVAPALVQVLTRDPHLHTARVPAHLRVNPTVSTKNMTHTDQWVHPPVAPAQALGQALVPHQAVQTLDQALQAAQAQAQAQALDLPLQAALAQAQAQAQALDLPLQAALAQAQAQAQVHPPAVQALAQAPMKKFKWEGKSNITNSNSTYSHLNLYNQSIFFFYKNCFFFKAHKKYAQI